MSIQSTVVDSCILLTVEYHFGAQPRAVARESIYQTAVKIDHCAASAICGGSRRVGQPAMTGKTPIAYLTGPFCPPNLENSKPQCMAPKNDRMTAPYEIWLYDIEHVSCPHDVKRSTKDPTSARRDAEALGLYLDLYCFQLEKDFWISEM